MEEQPNKIGEEPVAIDHPSNPGVWDFDVNALKVFVKRDDGDMIHAKEYKAVVHEKYPIVYYIGSNQYLPIPHRTLMKPVLENIPTEQFAINIRTTKDGARLYTDIMHHRPTDIPQIGEVTYGVRVVNSLDGSKRLGIHAIMERLVCSNGMVATEILAGFKRRHVQAKDLELNTFVEKIVDMLDVSIVQENLGKLLIPYERKDFEKMLVRIDLPKKYRESASNVYDMPEITGITPEERDTLWGAYNIVTYVLTHETEKMSFDRRFDFNVALDRAVAWDLTKYEKSLALATPPATA